MSMRATSFVGGVVLSAYMYLVVSATALGTNPLFVFEEGVAATTGIPFGVVTAVNGLLLLGLAAIMRAPVGPGTLSVPVMFGVGVEVMAPLVPSMGASAPGGFVLRLVVLVVATHLMALGAALVVRASFGAAAIDAVMLGLSSLLGRDTARVRLVMEVALAAGGVALGGAAGLGTIAAGLTVGHSFRYWTRLLGGTDRSTDRHSACRRSHRRATAPTSTRVTDMGMAPACRPRAGAMFQGELSSRPHADPV